MDPGLSEKELNYFLKQDLVIGHSINYHFKFTEDNFKFYYIPTTDNGFTKV